MRRMALFGVAALLAGSGIAWWLPESPDEPADAVSPSPVSAFDAGQPLEARVLELERALSEEREARQVLEEELLYVVSQLDEISGRPAARPGDEANPEERAVELRARRDEVIARRNSFEGRHERLVDAGLAPARAEWILRRESQMELDMLNLRHEAQRTRDFSEYQEQRAAADAAFRAELGPADYERYLEGSGRPTSISVNNVMDSSPAQTAGLRPGDEIRRYAGQRVYDMRDLNRLTLEGTPGETVYIDIVRDGIPMQVAVPRGPVGISGGGRRRQ